MCKMLKEFKMVEENYLKPHKIYSIKLQQSLYGLK